MKAAMYKSTPAGVRGIYNRLVRWWTRSAYSHVELVFADGMCASSSFMDGGVRFKRIALDPAKWDFIDLPAELELFARGWFEFHEGAKYDLLGNLQFILARLGHERSRWFCSEAIAASLCIAEPWRFDPATLATTLRWGAR